MANLTFFTKGNYELLLNIAKSATKARDFNAALKAINDCENAINEFIKAMKLNFDLFWKSSNELNDVIMNLAKRKKDPKLQEMKEQLTVEVNSLKKFLKKQEPQKFACEYQEKIKKLEMKLNEAFPTAPRM
jgi:hypothetical protein